MPLAVIFAVLATGETSQLMAAAGIRPRAWLVYLGNALILLSSWIPVILSYWGFWMLPAKAPLSWMDATALAAWPAMALTICTLASFVIEMRFFQKPGQVIANLAASALALMYVGLLASFLVQLRLAFGVGALVSLIIVVKMGDTGAYLVGRLLGRHKMAPTISPGKTWEGRPGPYSSLALGHG